MIQSASKPVAMSRTSFRRFLVHTQRDPPRRNGMTVEQLGLLLDTGLRIGEALGLRHEDVNTPDGVVEVRQRVKPA